MIDARTLAAVSSAVQYPVPNAKRKIAFNESETRSLEKPSNKESYT